MTTRTMGRVDVFAALVALLFMFTACEEVVDKPEPTADTAPSFAATVRDQTYQVGQSVDLSLPAAVGGNGALSYSLTQDVPGLAFDAETRTLSGTPSTAGTWAMTYTVADADDNTDPSDTATLRFTVTTSFAPPPNATLAGYPTGFSKTTRLNVSVGGEGVTYYKHKVVSLTTDEAGNLVHQDGSLAEPICTDSNYSTETPVNVRITDDISSFPEQYVTICVLGRNAAGVWQKEPTSVGLWIKDACYGTVPGPRASRLAQPAYEVFDFFPPATPTLFLEATYFGTSERRFLIRRKTETAHIHQVLLQDGSTIEIAVRAADFSTSFASELANSFGKILGSTPEFLREGLQRFAIVNPHDEPGAAGRYSSNTVQLEIPYFTHSGDLVDWIFGSKHELIRGYASTLIHELGHHVDFRDGLYSASSAWASAQDADGTHISAYAKTNHSEDFAETIGVYFPLRYMPEPMCAEAITGIQVAIPNRLRYLDTNLILNGRMCPIVPEDC